MLVGQEIGFGDVMMITAFGMFVSMAAMIILWWFVVILGKAVAWRESKGKTAAMSVEAKKFAQETDEAEVAAIVAATMAGTDKSQEEVAAMVAVILHQSEGVGQ